MTEAQSQEVIRLMRERDDYQIRMYGILWKLVIDEVISESKAAELAGMTAREFGDMLEWIVEEKT